VVDFLTARPQALYLPFYNFFSGMFTEEKLAPAVSLKKVLGAILEGHHFRTLILEYPNSVKDFAHPVTWCIGSA
jgi:hypothetical protein